MEEKDEKRKPIVIESEGLTLVDRVKLQIQTMHDFLEKEMPEQGWMYNKAVCCYYKDMPGIFAKCSSLYAQLDLDRWKDETYMFLMVSVLHTKFDICHSCYIKHGNKKQLLKALSQQSTVDEVMNAILDLSKSMEEKDYE